MGFADAALRDAFAPFLPPGSTPSEDAPVATFAVAREADIDPVDAAVRGCVAEHAPGHVFVHAGVVARGERALLLPASTHAGKSELVAALLRAGAAYASDEFAVLDGDGRVHPYPRPLSLRRPQPRDVPVAELGAPVATGPLEAAAIAFVRYEPGAQFAPQPLSAGAAALRLLEHAGQARAHAVRVVAALERAAAGAVLVEGERGEAADAAPALLALLEG